MARYAAAHAERSYAPPACNCEPHPSRIQPVEIDKALQRALQGRLVIQSNVIGHPGQHRPRAGQAMAEDAGAGMDHRQSGVNAIVDLPPLSVTLSDPDVWTMDSAQNW